MSINAIRTSWVCWLGVLAALVALPVGARAAEIDLGTYTLQANTANQTISIFVVGGTTASPALELVSGVSLNVETGDGGPNLGGSITAPTIQNVDLLASGAVFASNNTGQGGGGLQPNSSYTPYNPSMPTAAESQFWEATTQTAAMMDTAMLTATPQLLATITFDTTGISSGTFALVLDNPNQPTSFATGGTGQEFPTVIDGFLQIGGQVAPEPASMGLLALCLAGMLLRRRRFPLRAADSAC